MICPKCGVFIQEGRTYCQNCNAPIQQQTDPFYGEGYSSIQDGYGSTSPMQSPTQKTSKKGILKVFVVIIIIIFAVIGLMWWNQISLSIDDIDTEGSYLVITIKNNGWGKAKAAKITVHKNFDTDGFEWTGEDIKGGTKETARIEMPGAMIFDVVVKYDGWEQDRT
jgi:hypothetical protein